MRVVVALLCAVLMVLGVALTFAGASAIGVVAFGVGVLTLALQGR